MKALYFALLLVFFALPSSAATGPGTTIGAGIGVAAKPERTTPEEMDRIHAAGFTYVRFDMRWSEVEHEAGVYDWSAFDDFIGQLRTHGLKPLIILDSPNGLYGEKVDVPPEQSYGGTWDYAAPHDDKARGAFAAFAAAAVSHFGAKDIVWEIWNEPDLVAFWAPKPNANDFTKLALKTCRAMRTAKPDAYIIGPALARVPWRVDIRYERFFRTFIQSPVKDCLNAISIHPYRLNEPESVIGDYNDKARPFIAAYTGAGKPTVPVVNTEWGYSSSDVTPEQQAAYALRMHLSDLLAGVPISIMYEWSDTPGLPDPREAHFGLMDSDGKPKAGAKIIEQILPKIKNATLVKRLPVDGDDCYVVLIRQPNGKNQLLAWMGLSKLENSWTLHITDKNQQKPRSYALSLVPQLINIKASAPDIAVTKGPSLDAP
ncbi:MAG TPA: cellulase family glycosylhydrolase [Alphaproteobacteria bacterium]|nr:cellulase family glycosylhydrolase [Alphaproteobacteria bacterium]